MPKDSNNQIHDWLYVYILKLHILALFNMLWYAHSCCVLITKIIV